MSKKSKPVNHSHPVLAVLNKVAGKIQSTSNLRHQQAQDEVARLMGRVSASGNGNWGALRRDVIDGKVTQFQATDTLSNHGLSGSKPFFISESAWKLLGDMGLQDAVPTFSAVVPSVRLGSMEERSQFIKGLGADDFYPMPQTPAPDAPSYADARRQVVDELAGTGITPDSELGRIAATVMTHEMARRGECQPAPRKPGQKFEYPVHTSHPWMADKV
jgi:hypothetical protein